MVHLTAASETAEQPFVPPADQLYPHQLRMLSALRRLETDSRIEIQPTDPLYQSFKRFFTIRNHQVVSPINIQTRMGILSSPTGTGKIHPMVALAAQPYQGGLMESSSRINMLVNVTGVIDPIQCTGYLPSTLIVVPTNIYPQWYRVVKQSGVIFRGIYQHSDLEAWHTAYKLLKTCGDMALMPKIILLKHTLYNKMAIAFPYWNRLIVDEMNSIALTNNRPIYARFSWLVTTTSECLYHIRNRGYWRDIMTSISGQVLKVLEITIDQDYVAECLHKIQAVHHNITVTNTLKWSNFEGT